MKRRYVIIGCGLLSAICVFGSYAIRKPGQDIAPTIAESKTAPTTSIETFTEPMTSTEMRTMPPTTGTETLSPIDELRIRVGDEPLKGN